MCKKANMKIEDKIVLGGLDKELQDYIEYDARRMHLVSIKHPYYFSELFLNDEEKTSKINRINKSFRERKKLIKRGIEEGKWGFIISSLVEKPYRFYVFYDYQVNLTDKEYWKTLGKIFTQTERQTHQIDDWILSFNSKRPERENLMDDEDWDFYHQLPDKVKIWRGVNDEDWIKGLSWTTHKERGEWFARRFSNIYGGEILCNGYIEKERILMCSSNESLIVCNPKDITDLKTEKVKEV